jgi:hypothetical protein
MTWILAPLLGLAPVLVTVGAGGYERYDKPVEVSAAPSASVRVVEVDAGGKILDAEVPSQRDTDGTVTFLMKGVTLAGAKRYFRMHFERSGQAEPALSVQDVPSYQGQASFRVAAPNATYVYHKAGAGFASLLDRDGNDWISYRPEGGSDGKYRGIPNLIHPEGDFHPGGLNSTSRITAGPLKVTIFSETRDGKWAGQWDIFSQYARFTVLRTAHPYWFLYEGTPGGRLDLDRDYWVRSNGARASVKESWSGNLPSPSWVYFGDEPLRRVLFLVQHQDNQALDQFWEMQGNMTVFGFGRQYRCCEKYLTGVPAQFSIGFAETAEFGEVTKRIDSAFRPLEIQVQE